MCARVCLSQEFKAFFVEYFTGKADISSIDWDAWFHGVGGLPVIVKLDNSLRLAATQLAQAW